MVDLKQGGLDKFKNVSQEFGSDVELTELMTRKGMYIPTVSWTVSINSISIP